MSMEHGPADVAQGRGQQRKEQVKSEARLLGIQRRATRARYPKGVEFDEPSSSVSLLIVEDEAPILDGLTELFRAQGFTVTPAADGASALRYVEGGGFDLVILDLMLPKVGGLHVLERMRKRGDPTAVLLLTAKDTEDDVVRGIEAGADDYVTKPFGIRELLARVRGLLRRRRPGGAPRTVQIGRGLLDLDAARFVEDGAAVSLSAREALLLAYLALTPGRVVGREELLVRVWGYRDGMVRTRTVDVHIQQLREKIPRGHKRVTTVRGLGYRLEISA
jgi:DNA-binding response OmpR family regulator